MSSIYSMTRAEFRSLVATHMWQIWKENNPDEEDRTACPREFYQMAETAINLTVGMVDEMILDQIKKRLETLLPTHE